MAGVSIAIADLGGLEIDVMEGIRRRQWPIWAPLSDPERPEARIAGQLVGRLALPGTVR